MTSGPSPCTSEPSEPTSASPAPTSAPSPRTSAPSARTDVPSARTSAPSARTGVLSAPTCAPTAPTCAPTALPCAPTALAGASSETTRVRSPIRVLTIACLFMRMERVSTRTCEGSGADALPGLQPESPAELGRFGVMQIGYSHSGRTVRRGLGHPLTARVDHAGREPAVRVRRYGEADPARVVHSAPASLHRHVLVVRNAVRRVRHQYAVGPELVVLREQ